MEFLDIELRDKVHSESPAGVEQFLTPLLGRMSRSPINDGILGGQVRAPVAVKAELSPITNK